MSLFCRSDRKRCTICAVIISVVIGLVFAFAAMSENIVLSPIFFVVLLAVAILYMTATLLVAGVTYSNSRNLGNSPALFAQIVGIIGSIVLSVVGLLVDTAVSTAAITVVAGFYAFFFTLLLTSTLCIIKYLSNGNER